MIAIINRLPTLLLVLCLAPSALLAAPASAHQEAARTEQLQVGPYLLSVQLDEDPPHVEEPLMLRVHSLPSSASLDEAAVTVTGVPGPGTDATQTRVTNMRADPAEPGSYTGEVSFPVRGAWDLQLHASGPEGEATANVPITVAAPSAIPVWIGWLIGLSPLVGVAWFAWWNRNYLRRLRAERMPEPET
jgi:hypothetical protein